MSWEGEKSSGRNDFFSVPSRPDQHAAGGEKNPRLHRRRLETHLPAEDVRVPPDSPVDLHQNAGHRAEVPDRWRARVLDLQHRPVGGRLADRADLRPLEERRP